jgi:hypothetical protein
MDITEIEWRGTDLIDLTQDRDQQRSLETTVMNLRIP